MFNITVFFVQPRKSYPLLTYFQPK